MLLTAFALLATACGSDDDTESSTDTTTGEGGDTTVAPTDDGGAFPVTVEHKYGEITLDEAPAKVVSVGYTDQDFLLSLDVTPVAIRDWYGDQPFGTWEWAQDELGDAEPVLLPSTELNYEQIAALDPDLIVGISSGMTQEEYDTLSAIAPTLPQTADFPDYGMPWQDGLELMGKALGKSELATTLIDEIEAEFAAVVEAHPAFTGEATFSYVVSETEVGAYASSDSRSRLLTSLGFTIPAEIDELAGDLFYSTFSLERLNELDRDLLVWIGITGDIRAQVEAEPLHDSMEVVKNGAEIFLSEVQGAAAGFSSPLSLPFLLESFVPQLEAATDGDPATVVPEA